MFSQFGAPLVEGFDNESNYEDASDRCFVDNSTGKIKCRTEEADSDTSDEEEEQARNEELNENQNNTSSR